jgi:hypothetical protein
MKSGTAPQHAFTIEELLVLIAIIIVLAAIQSPALANTKSKVQRIHCGDNLKRIGLAFRTWADNRNGRFPMSVANSQGGAASAVGVARTGSWTGVSVPAIQGVWGMFFVMSNELSSPKILFCPAENSVSHNAVGASIKQAEVFGPQITGNPASFQNDFNISYFVGVDANTTLPNMLLVGDHNLGTGANQATKTAQFISAGTNAFWSATAIGWQSNNHNQQGNVLLTDGSVQNFNTGQFRDALNQAGGSPQGFTFSLAPGSQGFGVNRLQFP